MFGRIKLYKQFVVSFVVAVLVATTLIPVASAATGFSDVSSASSHAENIERAVEMGLIKGQNGKFQPNDAITRGQVVKILARYLENKHGKKSTSKVEPFADVTAKAKDKELYNASRVVKYHEAFMGDNNRLRPGEIMTREQMASVLVRAFELEPKAGNARITDIDQVSEHHRQNVRTIANLGITSTADGRFSPKQAVTRAQFSSFFVRTIDGHGGLPKSMNGLKITNIVALDDANQSLRIDFSKAITKLTPADIDIRHAISGTNYAVKAVELAENGKSAQVELFTNLMADRATVADYHVTVNVFGEELTYSFNRSTYIESFVVDIDVSKNKITYYTDKGSTKTIDMPATAKNLDLQELLGAKVRVWLDAKNKPTDVELMKQKTKYDAIEITKIDEIRLVSEGKTYKISTDTFPNAPKKNQFAFYLNGQNTEIGEKNDQKKKVKVKDRFNFAKVSFDDSGKVVFVSAYNLNEFLIVDRVQDKDVIGYPGEGTGGIFNAKDATIIQDGKVIKPSDLRRGDVVFFNKEANKKKGFAEVAGPFAKGAIDSVSSSEVRIDGTTYRLYELSKLEDYKVNYGAAVYLHPDGKTEMIDSAITRALQNTGTVKVYADRAGNVVYIEGGPVKLERNQAIALLLADIVGDRQSGREIFEVDALLATGERRWFTSDLDSLASIIVDDITYDISKNGKWKAEFVYKDAKNQKDPTTILLTSKTDKKTVKVPMDKTKGQLVRLHMDRDHRKLESMEFFKKRSASKKAVVKSSDTQISGKRLNPQTIVFDTEYFNSKDIQVTTWGAYKGSATVASMIYDENNTIIAFVTDKPPK